MGDWWYEREGVGLIFGFANAAGGQRGRERWRVTFLFCIARPARYCNDVAPISAKYF